MQEKFKKGLHSLFLKCIWFMRPSNCICLPHLGCLPRGNSILVPFSWLWNLHGI